LSPSFHQFIESHHLLEAHPTDAIQCNGTIEEAGQPDLATYSVELQLVTVVYGRGDSAVPPISGYLFNLLEFVEIAQGDVRMISKPFRTAH
jgi:hypothetical protein